MKKINLKNIVLGCCTVALLAISCDDNNQKSVTDGNDSPKDLSEAYDLKATTEEKALQIEQDALNYYWPVSDQMSYRLLMDDMDMDVEDKQMAEAKLTNQKRKKSLGVDEKDDLPTAKVVREEADKDYWWSYEQRDLVYRELSEKMKAVPAKLKTDTKKLEMEAKEFLKGKSVETDIKITDINRSRPPLFSKECMGEDNQEKCSNDAVIAWLKNEIDYPESALDKNHDGTERVTFTIGKTGKIEGDIKVMSKDNPCSGCTEAAIAAVKKMPNWIPGLQNGKPVSVEVVLPVKFRIK